MLKNQIMNKFSLVFLSLLFFSCGSTKYFVVRHAEKEINTMASDVSLSDIGKQRADALRGVLANEKIQDVYSTNYIRTKTTVQPTADAKQLQVQTYQPMDTTFFKSLRDSKRNILIAGHSNTVDDIVNQLLGHKQMSDLPETQYGDLFIVTKKGKKFSLEVKKF
jgi:2,3-bisphosphoglycerate-dependent phosphoglycerate mutase